MKRTILSLLLFIPFIGFGQTSWTYNFNNATAEASFSTNGGASETFLPAPLAGGGTARVRIGGSMAGGSFNLVNGGTSQGSGYELSGVASSLTGNNINKFQIFGYNASKVFSTTFKVRLSGPNNSGTWYFVQGSGVPFLLMPQYPLLKPLQV